MDTTPELQKQKKRTSTSTEGGTSSARGDVFDVLGNEQILAKVEEQKKIIGPTEEPPSLLAALGVEPQEQVVAPEVASTEEIAQEKIAAPVKETEEEKKIVAPPAEGLGEKKAEEKKIVAQAEEQPAAAAQRDIAKVTPEEQAVAAQKIGTVDDPTQAKIIAGQVGIDPVLLMNPKDLGGSAAAKEEVLGAEGQQLIDEKIDIAVATFGAGALDATGRKLVSERLTENLEVKDIVEARREGGLEALVEDATRRNALRSRDEVIFLLQQLMNDEGELRTVLTSTDPAAIAVQLVEYLAVMLVDFSDLYSLAAYDHADITQKIVVTDEALNIQRILSPLALKMGGFSSVMYQLVLNELAMHPMTPAGQVAAAPGSAGDPAADPASSTPKFKQNVFSLINQFRLFRTSAA